MGPAVPSGVGRPSARRAGRPTATAELVAAHAFADADADADAGGRAALVVLLGPDSEVGRAVLARRPDLAQAVLRRWQSLLPQASLAVEIVCHHAPAGRPASVGHAARMLAAARAAGVPAVLTNAVRYATPDGALTAGVLDAARRAVPLDARRPYRGDAEGDLAATSRMTAVAREVAEAAGDVAEASAVLADTRALAGRCLLDPAADLGIGSVHLPEPQVIGLRPGQDADDVLRRRCEAGIARRYPGGGGSLLPRVADRLDDELAVIARLGYASYFLTVERVCSLIRDDLGVRVAARGSGAGSLVNHLLGVSGVEPLGQGLLMERFLSPLRAQLPDIDLDVESARRTEVYERVLEHFGTTRVACVSMTDTYRARQAIRDAGTALGLDPGEIGAVARSVPHLRARNLRQVFRELPELRASGLDESRLGPLLDLAERLDGLPRHAALHPCGVILSDAALLDRTPVESSGRGFPMSQFDKDDVEDLGLIKLDVLGVRMQSAMAHALDEIVRVDGPGAAVAGGHPPDAPYVDHATGRLDLDAVPHDDGATFELIRTTQLLGVFQIESPGQRELVGTFAPETFDDLVIDISLFRPGPVASDMVTPFLRARQGWTLPERIHPDLVPVLADTCGVVVFHEQVLRIVSVTTGCTLAEADEVRRALGSERGLREVEDWFRQLATARGYDAATVSRIWDILVAFASFGFCKAHAAAFAVPTYHSAWLKAHHPAAFLAGVLTHDPGMYPKRLILDDARRLGITVLPLDVNVSDGVYRVEALGPPGGPSPGGPAAPRPGPGLPDGRAYGIRLSLADVKGISDAEIARIADARPYRSLTDFWQRATVSRPVVERLVTVGAFDSLHGSAARLPLSRRDRVTRRDLLLHVAELDRWPGSRARPGSGGGVRPVSRPGGPGQLVLDVGDTPGPALSRGLPEMTGAERTRTELDVLGLDASRHVVDFYVPLLEALGVTRAKEVIERRSRSELLVAGAKVAIQTPPVRSGRRVLFLTLDDATGPVNATFFEDVQGSCAVTVHRSWLLVVRGVLRRTGPRGVSLRATGAWDLTSLWDLWTAEGTDAVRALLASRPVPVPTSPGTTTSDGGLGNLRRALVHVSGYQQGEPGRRERSVCPRTGYSTR